MEASTEAVCQSSDLRSAGRCDTLLMAMAAREDDKRIRDLQSQCDTLRAELVFHLLIP